MCEVSDSDDARGATTDKLTLGTGLEVVGVNCKPLQSEGVDAEPDQSLAIGRVTSNRSTDGLVGRTTADPITLRNVTSESTSKSSCICSSVFNWVSDT